LQGDPQGGAELKEATYPARIEERETTSFKAPRKKLLRKNAVRTTKTTLSAKERLIMGSMEE